MMQQFGNLKKISAVMVAALSLLSFSLLFPVKERTAHADATKERNAMTEEERNWTLDDCTAVSEFIQNNFETFVEEYNSSLAEEDEPLTAEYVEFSAIIRLIEDDNYGVYLDFNGDNGYFVGTGDYVVYEMQTRGDLEYLRTASEITYGYADGFLYKDKDGVYQKCTVTVEEEVTEGSSDKKQNGGIRGVDLQAYMSENYAGYSLSDTVRNISPSFEITSQLETSYYLQIFKNKLGDFAEYHSEYNCVPTAAFNVLRDWRKRYLQIIPINSTVDVLSTIESDIFYEDYGTQKIAVDKEKKEYMWDVNFDRDDGYAMEHMPKVYSLIRDLAVEKYGYDPGSGMTSKYCENIMEEIALRYRMGIDVAETSSFDVAKQSLIDTKAVVLSMNGSTAYGNHACALLGYMEYRKKTGWWIFSKYEYIYIYELADGTEMDDGSKEVMFYDSNESSSVQLRYYTLVSY